MLITDISNVSYIDTIRSKIRTMWMTPFYLILGLFFVEFFKENINLKKLKKFYILFLFLFFISPITYYNINI